MIDPSQRLQLCTFRLGDLYLGIDVREVQEVVSHPEMTAVPHADYSVRGLINLRGQIATTVDLRRRFGMADKEDQGMPIHVVVRPAGEWISLLVDQIGDVVDVDPKDYEPPPETVESGSRDLILGAYKLANELLLIIDIAAATQLPSLQKERH